MILWFYKRAKWPAQSPSNWTRKSEDWESGTRKKPATALPSKSYPSLLCARSRSGKHCLGKALCAEADAVLSAASGICPLLPNMVLPASRLVCTYPAVPPAADTGIWRTGNGPASRHLLAAAGARSPPVSRPPAVVQWHPFTPHVRFLVSSYVCILQITMPFPRGLQWNPTYLGRAV